MFKYILILYLLLFVIIHNCKCEQLIIEILIKKFDESLIITKMMNKSEVIIY
jgi:hypothetical protein